MLHENDVALFDDADDFAEELALEFDGSHDPEAVWEWNGDAWVAVAA
jgi:hypothetical protein